MYTSPVLLSPPPGAKGNQPHLLSIYLIHQPHSQPYHTKQCNRYTLGNVEALASTDARSDYAVLELFCNFFLSREKS